MRVSVKLYVKSPMMSLLSEQSKKVIHQECYLVTCYLSYVIVPVLCLTVPVVSHVTHGVTCS